MVTLLISLLGLIAYAAVVRWIACTLATMNPSTETPIRPGRGEVVRFYRKTDIWA